MLIGYAYKSAHDQTMSLQQHALTAAGCGRIFSDIANGVEITRSGLGEMFAFAHANDTVVVWRLDRLASSLAQLIATIRHLEDKQIGFRSLNEQIDTTMPDGRLIFHVFGALAEFERALSTGRTPAGPAIPRPRGRHGGRPRVSVMHDPKKLAQARELYAERRITVVEICRLLGVSRSTFYAYVPERVAHVVTKS